MASVPSEERLLVLRRGRVLGACRAGDPPQPRRLGAPPPHPGAVRLDGGEGEEQREERGDESLRGHDVAHHPGADAQEQARLRHHGDAVVDQRLPVAAAAAEEEGAEHVGERAPRDHERGEGDRRLEDEPGDDAEDRDVQRAAAGAGDGRGQEGEDARKNRAAEVGLRGRWCRQVRAPLGLVDCWASRCCSGRGDQDLRGVHHRHHLAYCRGGDLELENVPCFVL